MSSVKSSITRGVKSALWHPARAAMFLAGLGAIGFIARRRKN
jgi:MYXO-CTERM domain-containing protein